MSSSPSIDSEDLKHRNALDLEARKWEYKQEELRYLEAGQHLRSLNQLMWQVPGMVVAITGGLWYGALSVDSDLARSAVLGFAAVFDVLAIIIISRLRDLIKRHIELQARFARIDDSASDVGRGTVVACWKGALLAAAAVGAAGAFFPSTLVKRSLTPVAQGPLTCCQTPTATAAKNLDVVEAAAQRALCAPELRSGRCSP